MAKNTTATGATIDGVTVVHPDNIGKGILWDEATKTYYVAIDDKMFERDELGRLKLRVSALEDNQLKFREDGLYQGSTARADLQNLYVANHGNDNNAGTREAPLKTIQAALDRLENITAYYRIWLHEGHQFDWVYVNKPFISVFFDVYGPSVDTTFPMATPNNAHYRGYTAKHFPRPTINVRVNERENRIERQFLVCAEVTIRGVRLEIHNKYTGFDDGTKVGSFTGMFDCTNTFTIHGCILNEASKGVPIGSGAGSYRSDVIFRANRVLWVDSLSENLPELVSSGYTSQLTLLTWNYDTLQGLGEAPNHEALIKFATAFKDMSRGMRNKIHGVTFLDDTKSVLGMSLNWDIFANP